MSLGISREPALPSAGERKGIRASSKQPDLGEEDGAQDPASIHTVALRNEQGSAVASRENLRGDQGIKL